MPNKRSNLIYQPPLIDDATEEILERACELFSEFSTESRQEIVLKPSSGALQRSGSWCARKGKMA